MVVKWPTIPVIAQVPISRLYPKLTPNLLWQPERISNAKGLGTESEMAERKKRKAETEKKNFRNGQTKRVKVKVKNLSYKLLVFGYRGLIKKIKQTTVINLLKTRIS